MQMGKNSGLMLFLVIQKGRKVVHMAFDNISATHLQLALTGMTVVFAALAVPEIGFHPVDLALENRDLGLFPDPAHHGLVGDRCLA